MKIAFIRGKYLNNFELQSYYPIKNPDINITTISSFKPKHKTKLNNIPLLSPMDIPNIPYKMPILNRIYKDAMYLYGLENKLKKFDIAHVRETYFHFSSQAVYAKQKGYIKKILVTCSETIINNHETIRGRKQLKQNVIKNADYFHTLTQKAKQTLIAEGVSSDKIITIPYGININRFKTENRSFDKKNITFLFIGRLENQKGVNELIQAWKLIKKEHYNVNLRIIGKGKLSKKLKKLDITPQFYTYNQIPKVFASADVLILPSKPDKYWEEYFGMVLLEAMSSSLPIITTNCGAIPEVVSDSAMIINHSNVIELKNAMKSMLSKKIRILYSIKGFNRVSHFYDINKQSKKIEELYLNI